MPDLHAWITAQVDRVEADARYAADGFMFFDTGDTGVVDHYQGAGSPEAVLRRCEADRRILERHRADPDETDPLDAHACQACSYTDRGRTIGIKSTVDLADCPELLDLARAHGITDEILNSLDRPQRPEIKPWEYRPRTAMAGVPDGQVTDADHHHVSLASHPGDVALWARWHGYETFTTGQHQGIGQFRLHLRRGQEELVTGIPADLFWDGQKITLEWPAREAP
ncbi:hypothetical protein [Streptomyces sp. NPDC001205]